MFVLGFSSIGFICMVVGNLYVKVCKVCVCLILLLFDVMVVLLDIFCGLNGVIESLCCKVV